MSVSEQRYQAVLAVIGEGDTVTEVAARFGVSRKTLHVWLARYEAGGLENLGDRSHRPVSCPHQMAPAVEVVLAELRRAHPSWGPRRLVFELGRRGVEPLPSESGVYRALVRLNLIDPAARRPRDRKWKRWERGRPMELWQMDVVGGFVLADGTKAKVLTGVDDHSRFCVCAQVMPRESSRHVCDGLAAAMRRWGVPEEILTDNGKVFTGRFNQPPVEVLFDRICRENGITHRLTQPRSPTTTGKIERFHRSLRARVPHRPGVRRPGCGAGRARRVGRRLQHEPAASSDRDGHPRRTVPARRAGAGDTAANRRRRSTGPSRGDGSGSLGEPARSGSSA